MKEPLVKKDLRWVTATIQNYGVTLNKKNLPVVRVDFKLEDTEEKKHAYWWGHFTGKARPITLRTLVNVMGYSGADDLSDLCEGNALDTEKEYRVGLEESTNAAGNTFLNVSAVAVNKWTKTAPKEFIRVTPAQLKESLGESYTADVLELKMKEASKTEEEFGF